MLQLLWSVDPAMPGPDDPPAGVSLFDRATHDSQGRQSIPFPFERLVARIEAAAGCSARDPCTRAVLIPLGRSLQRVAASPDFFAHPRVVVAVVGDGRGPLLLKDRLYLGYQDKADVIEVISYNESLGRFEFQVVRNYSAARTPTVAYARRTLCVSCHQNHAPIFSRQVWLETNANPQIAALLEQQQSAFHGVPARGAADIANAIDDATDRANRLSLAQTLWREGCGEGDAGDRCRRGAFIAALQFGLTGGRAYDVNSEIFRRDVIARLQSRARSQWLDGVAVPDADLVNRDPLAIPAQSGPAELVHVAARFDPLVPRAPVEILPADGKILAAELVQGVAGFASGAALDALASALPRRADSYEIEVPCAIEVAARQTTFDCNSFSRSPRTTGTQDGSHLPPVAGGGQGGGAAEYLAGSIHGDMGNLDALSVRGGEPIRHLQLKKLNANTFAVRDRGRSARLPDGDALESITLSQSQSRATIRIRADFSTATAALLSSPSAATAALLSSPPATTEALLSSPSPDDEAFISSPSPALRGKAGRGRGQLKLTTLRSSSIHDFIAALRGAPAASCCDDSRSTPVVTENRERIAKPALAFEPACGSCHHTDDVAPPNFLSGDAERVNAALDSCAPRIYVRMAMQDLEPGQRDKSPMPPEVFSAVSAVNSGRAPSLARLRRTGEGIGSIRRGIEDRLRAEYGRLPAVAELLRHGYENLRPCLPASG